LEKDETMGKLPTLYRTLSYMGVPPQGQKNCTRWRFSRQRRAEAQRGCIDEKAVVLELFTAIARAGANIILTYWAKDVARWL
jgi:hypothetical protein